MWQIEHSWTFPDIPEKVVVAEVEVAGCSSAPAKRKCVGIEERGERRVRRVGRESVQRREREERGERKVGRNSLRERAEGGERREEREKWGERR